MEKTSTIMLVVGKELWGAERIRQALFEAGYKIIAVEAWEVQEAVIHHQPDLVIANLSGLPADDLNLCQRLTRNCRAPVIAIGSVSDETYQATFLDIGIDDYLIRPVNPRELVARVRSILRRTQPAVLAEAKEPAVPGPATQPVQDRSVKWSFATIIHHLNRRIAISRFR